MKAGETAGLNEAELYTELGVLTKEKNRWEESIPYVSSLLNHDSAKIQAKALWLLGEMGLKYPLTVRDAVPAIASLCDSSSPLLRARAVNALGRIGRGNFQLIKSYFIWASENIATNTPDVYQDHMPVFAKLLYDTDDKVRMEAPEIFRVLGKRRPEFVRPFLEQLQRISEIDSNRVVRIHCLGAIKATADSF